MLQGKPTVDKVSPVSLERDLSELNNTKRQVSGRMIQLKDRILDTSVTNTLHASVRALTL